MVSIKKLWKKIKEWAVVCSSHDRNKVISTHTPFKSSFNSSTENTFDKDECKSTWYECYENTRKYNPELASGKLRVPWTDIHNF
jgi:hypothetical protein